MVYIFDPEQGSVASERPAKKRRVARKPTKEQKAANPTSTTFIPLLNGSEKASCVALRQKLYEESWAKIEDRIQVSNQSTQNVLKTVMCREMEKADGKDEENPTRCQLGYVGPSCVVCAWCEGWAVRHTP